MASSISSIDNSIKMYSDKIAERENFIKNANLLIENANQASDELINASENLSLGLTIGGKPIDDGMFSSMSTNLKKYISNLQSSIRIAVNDIKSYSDRIYALQAERKRLVDEERAAAAAAAAKRRREDADSTYGNKSATKPKSTNSNKKQND